MRPCVHVILCVSVCVHVSVLVGKDGREGQRGVGRNLGQNRYPGDERGLFFPGLSAACCRGQEQIDSGEPSRGAESGALGCTRPL